jgi:polyhydroxyalkanoate synthesis regulator phasin
MTETELGKLLEKLHDELGKIGELDEKGRALLSDINADIQEILDRGEGGKPRSDESTLRRFQDAIDHFEVTYPALTSALSEMMTILSNAGI